MSDSADRDEAIRLKRVVKEKCLASGTPGFVVEFSAEECEMAGAFVEDALSAAEALGAVDELPFSSERGDAL